MRLDFARFLAAVRRDDPNARALARTMLPALDGHGAQAIRNALAATNDQPRTCEAEYLSALSE